MNLACMEDFGQQHQLYAEYSRFSSLFGFMGCLCYLQVYVGMF